MLEESTTIVWAAYTTGSQFITDDQNLWIWQCKWPSSKRDVCLLHTQGTLADFVLPSTTLDKAIAIFRRSEYHQYEHARALFLKSQVLRDSKDEAGSIAALESSAELRRQFCGDNLIALEDLSIEHFDEYVALWNR